MVTNLQAVFPILMGKPSADEGDLRTGNFFTDGSSDAIYHSKLVESVSPPTTAAVLTNDLWAQQRYMYAQRGGSYPMPTPYTGPGAARGAQRPRQRRVHARPHRRIHGALEQTVTAVTALLVPTSLDRLVTCEKPS